MALVKMLLTIFALLCVIGVAHPDATAEEGVEFLQYINDVERLNATLSEITSDLSINLKAGKYNQTEIKQAIDGIHSELDKAEQDVIAEIQKTTLNLDEQLKKANFNPNVIISENLGKLRESINKLNDNLKLKYLKTFHASAV